MSKRQQAPRRATAWAVDAAGPDAAVDGLRPTHEPLGKLRSGVSRSPLKNAKRVFHSDAQPLLLPFQIRSEAEAGWRSVRSRPIHGGLSKPSTLKAGLLRGQDLSEANLSGADLREFDLLGANLGERRKRTVAT